jgi:hypothetical protein
MGENRDEYRGKRKDKEVVCLKAEEITKTAGFLI